MTDIEIVNYIEYYGTEEQRVLVDKLCNFFDPEEPDWDECPYCDDKIGKIDELKDEVAEKDVEIDELEQKITHAMEALE